MDIVSHGHKPEENNHLETKSRRRAVELKQRRYLRLLTMTSLLSLVTGAAIAAIGTCLMVLLSTFTFATGLPVLVGTLEEVGAIVLCCISGRGRTMITYTSCVHCKWQCALLIFTNVFVLCLGTLNVTFTLAFTTLKFSLLGHDDPLIFRMTLTCCILTSFTVIRVICTLVLICNYKHKFGTRNHTSYSFYYRKNTEDDMTNRLIVLSNVPEHTAHRQRDLTTYPNVHSNVDRKGYYLWDI